jgi:hypothetical protein
MPPMDDIMNQQIPEIAPNTNPMVAPLATSDPNRKSSGTNPPSPKHSKLSQVGVPTYALGVAWCSS